MIDTVKLGGIKLSAELVQLDFFGAESPDTTLVKMLQRIASAKINIPHLHQGVVKDKLQTTLCVAAEHFPLLHSGLISELNGRWHQVRPSVGTISLFPHKASLEIFAQLISTFAAKSIPIYGISTSVSALVVHTDYTLLEKAVDAVLTFAELPKNHTPLRPVVVLGGEEVETIAVYWEPKIRIYGMDIVKNLCYLKIACSAADLCDEKWIKLIGGNYRFRLVTGRVDDQKDFCLEIVVDKKEAARLMEDLSPMTIRDKVEMISFHGPHFQDRYGIASMAFNQLHDEKIQLLTTGYTGTSVQLVVTEGMAENVASSLDSTFIVPSRESS